MLEIKPEHMLKGEIYYIQNEASENKVEYDKYTKWKEDIISSGVEYSKDELKYIKMI